MFNDDKDDIERGELNSQSSLQDRYPARMVEGRKMTDDASDREVFLIVLDLEESGLQYIPGDALDLVPENDAELVDALLQRLGLNGSQRLKIKTLDGTTKEMPHIPEGFTIRCDSLRNMTSFVTLNRQRLLIEKLGIEWRSKEVHSELLGPSLQR